MRHLLSPKQVAQAIGKSEATIKRWCDSGVFKTYRSEGGHRKIPLDEVARYLRENDLPLADPELLSLPSNTGDGGLPLRRARADFERALIAGDSPLFDQAGYNLFLSGMPIHRICDEAIAPAFHAIGERWERGELEIYRERRATEICQELLIDLRRLIPPPGPDASLALGATLREDDYRLPSLMVDVALREAGWRSEWLGTGLPAPTVRQAVIDRRPRLLYVSFTGIIIDESLIEEFSALHSAAHDIGVCVAIGGRALTPAILARLPHTIYCARIGQLIEFIASIERR